NGGALYFIEFSDAAPKSQAISFRGFKVLPVGFLSDSELVVKVLKIDKAERVFESYFGILKPTNVAKNGFSENEVARIQMQNKSFATDGDCSSGKYALQEFDGSDFFVRVGANVKPDFTFDRRTGLAEKQVSYVNNLAKFIKWNKSGR